MLKLSHVKKTFNKGTVTEKRALTGVDLTLNDGDFVTMIGGNGAGKSTPVSYTHLVVEQIAPRLAARLGHAQVNARIARLHVAHIGKVEQWIAQHLSLIHISGAWGRRSPAQGM